MTLAREIVVDIANQVGGASPSTSTIKDWSRYKNNGTLTGITWSQEPTGLWVPVFDGSTSVIDCGGHSSTKCLYGLTIELWINPTNIAEWDRFADNESAGAGYVLAFAASNALRFRCNRGAVMDTNSTLTAGVWAHIVATWDGTTKKIFVNGVQDAVTAAFAGPIVASSVNVFWGRYSEGATTYFDGKQSKQRILNYALTSAQIRARYHSTKWLFGVAS